MLNGKVMIILLTIGLILIEQFDWIEDIVI